ncbi:hypothetical protein UFOVP626_7 [uncultured Caudovirales phage]|uniref:Uncharacterized protein n=1 Tax=uncultured Caudovirales phage TaxID=2100421 RepID=A0A6J5QYP1_9CAUD|nr:hypothetical protein UFOVP626_7 [uncultured Caudovirales phage]CAB4172771.1 hypothetical protein UFOVP951_2 [uncultured Caudovirales phage]CAB4184694.1 hypothetical protein UFOVP1115_29 [uncultured Caudovirales phage]CAB4203904.1 hypothetical protein UFOVP1390_13 [uncultured Caudovirales phage]CAB5238347.1 hypothetical protein UFOVP1567_28 [uncultured Caudovirales phage]
MTFLELINDVLIRLREPSVTSNAQNAYSTLIGRFVNDAKRQVEDSFGWNVLGKTVTLTTVSATYSYSMTGAGQKFEVLDAINTTSNIGLKNISFVEMNRYQNLVPTTNGIPQYYAFDGVDASGDTKVLLYPRPDGVYSIPFSLVVPQAKLAADATVVLVPDFLVVQNAYARALVERGEDGGLNSSEAYQLYRGMLSDQIALEGTRFPEQQEFVAI